MSALSLFSERGRWRKSKLSYIEVGHLHPEGCRDDWKRWESSKMEEKRRGKQEKTDTAANNIRKYEGRKREGDDFQRRIK